MRWFGNLYKRLRYGIRITSTEFVSTIVKCQDVMMMDTYDCSECGFLQICFYDNRERFFRYLKRNDMYRHGQIALVGASSVLEVDEDE